MMLNYLIYFTVAFVLSAIFTLIAKKMFSHLGVVDNPEPANERKIHTHPIPFGGGAAIFLSFFIIIFYLAFVQNKIFFIDEFLGYAILPQHLWGIFAGGIFLMIGGFLDDKYRLSPIKQVAWPIIARLIIILAGVGIKFITNPLGGVIRLDTLSFYFLNNEIFLFAALFTFLWLLGMSYTTKFLDGLDGLASGIAFIGTIIIFILSVNIRQPQTALITVVFAGSILGFLIFNFNPAKIFLGEGGSTFLGFMLAALAVISGGKIATALLIMGVPILDVFGVIITRVFKQESPFRHSDTKHLHFRLFLDLGLSHRATVLILYFVTAIFGVTALYLKSWGKLIALGVLMVFMIVFAGVVVKIKVKHGREF